MITALAHLRPDVAGKRAELVIIGVKIGSRRTSAPSRGP
jgi:hypothetical protein